MTIFDVALEGRFAGSPEISLLDVTAADTLLIRNSADGVVMRIPFSVLTAAIAAGLASTFEPPIAVGTTGQYWRGDKSWQTLDKAAVGLGSVDNTADSAKSVSYATTAGAAPASDVYTWAKAATKPSYTKAEVGLTSVDDTSDANKPVSTAQSTAIALKAAKAGDTFTGPVTVAQTSAGAEVTLLTLSNTSSTAGTTVTIRLAPTSDPSIRYGAIQGIETGSNNVDIAFVTGAGSTITEKGRFKASGQFLIATSTIDGSGNKLQVNGGISFAPTTGTTAPAAGGAGALPATPLGYATVWINGSARQLPYY